MNNGHWNFDCVIDPSMQAGFIYCITNLKNNKKYIGQKSFFRKNGKEHSWRYYTSSSVDLNKDIQAHGKDNFRFDVLELTNDLDSKEHEYQCKLNVLEAVLPSGSRAFYNKSIQGKHFSSRSIDTQSRNKNIIKSRKQNRILIKEVDVNQVHTFFNIVTSETYTGSSMSLSEISGAKLADVIKLTKKERSLVKGWVLFDKVKLTSPNLDDAIYRLINADTGERIEGNRAVLICKLKTSCTAFSTALNHKKYIKRWVFCDENWAKLTEYCDKRKEVTGNRHHRSDNKKYTIINVNSNEVFTGSRHDIKTKLDIKTDLCHAFVKGAVKVCKKEWIVRDSS